MLGSNIEDASEQTHGREMEPTALGRGRKEKSHDASAKMVARLTEVELGMEDT